MNGSNILKNRGTRLFIMLGGFFVANALVAEFIGIKIFSLENSLGIKPFNWNLFGHKGSLMLSAGVLIWPIVFIMTDVINEYFGRKGVKLLSYLTAALIAYGFVVIYLAVGLSPADFWIKDFEAQGVPDMQVAFKAVMGQGQWIIIASLIAFLIGQIIDAQVFYRIRSLTGKENVWLRATLSTAISQLIDSFIVLYIAFVLGPPKWALSLFFAVGIVNYSYKLLIAILLIPSLYLIHYIIDAYLGKEQASIMKQEAMMD